MHRLSFEGLITEEKGKSLPNMDFSSLPLKYVKIRVYNVIKPKNLEAKFTFVRIYFFLYRLNTYVAIIFYLWNYASLEIIIFIHFFHHVVKILKSDAITIFKFSVIITVSLDSNIN